MTRQTAANSELNWMEIAAISFFVTGAFLAFAFTSLPRLTPHNWIYWVGGRIIWQLGGGVWFGVAVGNALAGRKHWKGAALGAALGALIGLALCFNPVVDIILGPQVWQGRVTHVEISRGKVYRRTGFSETIHARINIQTQDNEQHIELGGRQANLWGEVFDQCYRSSGMISAVVLHRLAVVLKADCSTIRNEHLR